MRCEQFESRLQHLLDERASLGVGFDRNLDSRLSRHAAQCEHCRGLLVGAERLVAGMAAYERPEPPHDFAARVVAQSIFERRQKSSRMPWPALAAAAAVLIAVGVLWLVRDRAGGAANLAKNAPQGTKPAVAAGNTPVGGKTASGLELPELGKHEIKNLARGAGQKFATAVMYFPDYRNGDDTSAGGAPPEWIVQVSNGLRPLTDSVTGAFDLLRRTMPGLHDGNRL